MMTWTVYFVCWLDMKAIADDVSLCILFGTYCNLQHLIIEMDGPDVSRYALFPTHIHIFIYIYLHIYKYIYIYICSICIHDYSTYMYITYHVYRFTSLSWRIPPWRINEFHCCYGLSRLVRQWWGLPGGHRVGGNQWTWAISYNPIQYDLIARLCHTLTSNSLMTEIL